MVCWDFSAGSFSFGIVCLSRKFSAGIRSGKAHVCLLGDGPLRDTLEGRFTILLMEFGVFESKQIHNPKF